ncbi:MAG: tol-pal system protein YbgF [Thermodesulfovibrionales bacterium]
MKRRPLIRTISRAATLAAGTAALFSLSACVTDLGSGKDLRAEVNELRQQSFETRQQIKEMRGELAQIKAKASGAAGEESLEAIRRSQQDLYMQLQQVTRDVQLLSGRFDENKYFMDRYLKESSKEIEGLRAKVGEGGSPADRQSLEAVKKKLQALEAEVEALRKGAPAAASPGAAVPAPAPEAKAPAAGPEKAYDAAYDKFKEGRYGEAREGMRAFLRDYPRHELAGNAQFWIAETFYAEGDYDDAILAYEEVLQNYRDNRKVPAAMLKQAYAFRELGDRKAARGILKELIARFPGSEQAKAAEQDLKKLAEPKAN